MRRAVLAFATGLLAMAVGVMLVIAFLAMYVLMKIVG